TAQSCSVYLTPDNLRCCKDIQDLFQTISMAVILAVIKTVGSLSEPGCFAWFSLLLCLGFEKTPGKTGYGSRSRASRLQRSQRNVGNEGQIPAVSYERHPDKNDGSSHWVAGCPR
ncbi:MAG TPA: hypothetical protein VKA08_13720, partial [Balneolales bacterium]|nr:hypothetical protein [Balneolales bacterium]